MTRRYVFRPDTVRRYALVSTTAVGRPGPPGADGSGLPGIEIHQLGINSAGEVSFEWLSHFGITADGDPYYSANPDLIPAEDMAWYDVVTNSVTRGIPGRGTPGSGNGTGLRSRGEWQPNTSYAEDDWFTFGGSSYVVTEPFTSGTSFSELHLDILAGEGMQGPQGPAGASLLVGTAVPDTGVGNNGDTYLRRVLNGSDQLADLLLYGPKTSGQWPSGPVSLIGPQGLPGADSNVPGPPGPPSQLSSDPPANLGFSAYQGGSSQAARSDHVHKSPIPGTDFTLSVVGGEVVLDIVTNFGINEDGAYYEPDPSDVPQDERAIFNPFERSLELL